MAPDRAILLPAVAMVLVTAGVWLRMYSDRLTEIRDRRIHPQKLANTRQAGELLQNTQASDHLKTCSRCRCCSTHCAAMSHSLG
jgi:hypothetical protein